MARRDEASGYGAGSKSRSEKPPCFAPEAALARRAGGPTCGVDEVGRGPLAGPVVAGAALLDAEAAAALAAMGLRDSKSLSKPKIAALAAAIVGWRGPGRVAIGVGAASVAEIAARNIAGATHLAMRRAVGRLPTRPAAALIDGKHAPTDWDMPVETLVGADALSASVAAAAVAAKAARDALMRRLAARWPVYGWERNAGYGSAAHRAALRAYGPSPHHRLGFCRRVLEEAAAIDAR